MFEFCLVTAVLNCLDCSDMSATHKALLEKRQTDIAGYPIVSKNGFSAILCTMRSDRRRGGTDRIGTAILLCHFQRACEHQIVYSGGAGIIAKML